MPRTQATPTKPSRKKAATIAQCRAEAKRLNLDKLKINQCPRNPQSAIVSATDAEWRISLANLLATFKIFKPSDPDDDIREGLIRVSRAEKIRKFRDAMN